MLKIVITACITTVIYVLVLAVVGFWYLSNALQAPSFYQQAMAKEVPVEVRQKQREKLEQKALKLQDELLTPDTSTTSIPTSHTSEAPEEPLQTPSTPDEENAVELWSIEVTQEEINSWLIDQKSFELPPEIQEPRFVIEENEMKIGAKISRSGLTGFIALAVVPHYQDRVLTLDLLSLKAGNLELGVADIAQSIYAQLPENTRNACELDTSGPTVQLHIPLTIKSTSQTQLTDVLLNEGTMTFQGTRLLK